MKKSPTPSSKSPVQKLSPSNKATARAARPMTKRQLSRHQRDLRLQRLAKIGFAALIGVVAVIIAFGYWHELIQPGGEAMLRVRGTDISTQTYAKVLGWEQYSVDLQMARLQGFAATQASNPQSGDSSFIRQYVEQQLQQLQQQRGALEGQVIEELIDHELYRQEAVTRNISISTADIDAEIVRQQSPSPTPTPEATSVPAGQPGETPTPQPTPEATPAPTPTPRSPQQIMSDLQKQLDEYGLMTMDEYRELIAKPKIVQDRLQTVFGAQLPVSREQIWARHILVDEESDATDLLAKLQAGGDFASLAKDLSTDTSNKDKAGDLGWFPRGMMVSEFEDAAFTLQSGEIVSAPVKTQFGYHVIQVLARDPDRQLTDDQLKQAKDSAFSKWLENQRTEKGAIEYGYSLDRIKWARDWVSNNAKYMKAARAGAKTPATR